MPEDGEGRMSRRRGEGTGGAFTAGKLIANFTAMHVARQCRYSAILVKVGYVYGRALGTERSKAMRRALFEYAEDRKKWAFTESWMNLSY